MRNSTQRYCESPIESRADSMSGTNGNTPAHDLWLPPHCRKSRRDHVSAGHVSDAARPQAWACNSSTSPLGPCPSSYEINYDNGAATRRVHWQETQWYASDAVAHQQCVSEVKMPHSYSTHGRSAHADASDDASWSDFQK